MGGFVVVYYGNTGSSWLVEALGTSPDVLVPGFEPLEDWAWDAPVAERTEWLSMALDPPEAREGPDYDRWVERMRASPQTPMEYYKPSFRMVGFKMKDLIARDTDAVVKALSAVGAKVINLVRRNRIKHALSLYRYHVEGKSQFDGKGTRPKTRLDFDVFDEYVEESKRLHEAAESIEAACVERLGAESVTRVGYEEFVDEEGKRDTLSRLSGFLGIEPPTLRRSSYTKATPDDLRSAVENYTALRLRYLFTPLRVHFRD